jgi:tetratricopeptide (TPR) repeat protein
MTVMIDGYGSGSGVIFKQEGNEYFVITAKHVVERPNTSYLIATYDDERYEVNSDSITPLPNLDIAIIKFRSSKQYQHVTFGDPDRYTGGQPIYIAGAPEPTPPLISRSIIFTSGKVIGREKEASDGYSLIYDNSTQPGMSGGPILDRNARLIGIHGQGSRKASGKSGINYGIPIDLPLPDKVRSPLLRWWWAYWQWVIYPSAVLLLVIGFKQRQRIYLFFLAKKELDSEIDYVNQGIKIYQKGQYQESIRLFTNAIKSNPLYGNAYYHRGNAKFELADYQGALSDYNEAVRFIPDSADIYCSRGNAKSALANFQEAIKDYNLAVSLNPLFAKAYCARGDAKVAINENGAIDDYNNAIQMQSDYADAYFSRANFKLSISDISGAINDYNEAIRINPFMASAYYGRGNAKSELGYDDDLAINDYDSAIHLNPNHGDAYYHRANIKAKKGDYQVAISDYNEAIRINSKNADAYHNRGKAKLALGDVSGSKLDYKKASEIWAKQP